MNKQFRKGIFMLLIILISCLITGCSKYTDNRTTEIKKIDSPEESLASGGGDLIKLNTTITHVKKESSLGNASKILNALITDSKELIDDSLVDYDYIRLDTEGNYEVFIIKEYDDKIVFDIALGDSLENVEDHLGQAPFVYGNYLRIYKYKDLYLGIIGEEQVDYVMACTLPNNYEEDIFTKLLTEMYNTSLENYEDFQYYYAYHELFKEYSGIEMELKENLAAFTVFDNYRGERENLQSDNATIQISYSDKNKIADAMNHLILEWKTDDTTIPNHYGILNDHLTYCIEEESGKIYIFDSNTSNRIDLLEQVGYKGTVRKEIEVGNNVILLKDKKNTPIYVYCREDKDGKLSFTLDPINRINTNNDSYLIESKMDGTDFEWMKIYKGSKASQELLFQWNRDESSGISINIPSYDNPFKMIVDIGDYDKDGEDEIYINDNYIFILHNEEYQLAIEDYFTYEYEDVDGDGVLELHTPTIRTYTSEPYMELNQVNVLTLGQYTYSYDLTWKKYENKLEESQKIFQQNPSPLNFLRLLNSYATLGMKDEIEELIEVNEALVNNTEFYYELFYSSSVNPEYFDDYFGYVLSSAYVHQSEWQRLREYYTETVITFGDRNYNLKDAFVEEQLTQLTEDELNILKNAIFAQYGYRFNSKKYQDYFIDIPWYEPKYDDVETMMTDIDQHNIDLILSML
ncbi:YARHG domain-containing protein [Vallitalea okinawensis]|uniref:YARHG domain-containing protein n=1 Tax=Vallitalea okinawensis TaxID=2078660 RepID=UPI000CFBD5C6|nr:YARHG domain-containing protein [Vallitalea okinawensis]